MSFAQVEATFVYFAFGDVCMTFMQPSVTIGQGVGRVGVQLLVPLFASLRWRMPAAVKNFAGRLRDMAGRKRCVRWNSASLNDLASRAAKILSTGYMHTGAFEVACAAIVTSLARTDGQVSVVPRPGGTVVSTA